MATVEFRYDPKNTAWFTANAAMVLKAGEPAYHDTTGLFKLGDGITALSALSFLPTVSASTPTIQQVLTAGQVATTTIETTGFIKTGGLSTQFLKADGTVDSSTYLTTLGTAATSLTTTGSSGAATLIANVLNVPNYTLAGLGGTTLAAVNAQNLSVFAATTSSQLAGVISDETGSGALVFGTSPTFTTGITTPLINGTSGTLQIGTTDLVNIGNKTTTSQRLVRIGQDTAWIDIGSQSGSTARGAIYINQATPDTTNYALSAHQTAGQTYLNGKNGVNFLANGGIIATWIASQAAFLVQPANGNTINYQFTVPNNTALTASTEVPIFKIIGGNNTWNTGAITNQKWSWITANTANFSAASIITNSYGLYVEAATAGTNATITNNFSLGGSAGTGSFALGNLTGSTSKMALYFEQATPSATNWIISSNGNDTYLNSAGILRITYAAATRIQVSNTNIFFANISTVTFDNAANLVFNTSTGSKLGTATTQKLSFWNATPIVQPTTAVAAATLVSNAGTALTSTDTFDGYTLQQMVKALRNIGLLA